MSSSRGFEGFPKECARFWADLAANNDKVWFDAHKRDYEQYVLEPSRAFVAAMGESLREVRPKVVADPRANKSLFRIYRDTRFSKDKRPYKTHMGIIFWEGAAKRMECSGFYFHLEPESLMLGGGLYMFPKRLIEPYRMRAADKKTGAALRKAIDRSVEAGGFRIGGSHYKRVPRGFDSDGPNAELLKHNGLYLYENMPLPKELYGPEIVDFCVERWKIMEPLHAWLVELTEKS